MFIESGNKFQVESKKILAEYPVQLILPCEAIEAISGLCGKRGATFVDLGPIPNTRLREFYEENRGKRNFKNVLNSLVVTTGETDTAQRRYNVEYGSYGCPHFAEAIEQLDLQDGVLQRLQAAYLREPNYSFYSPPIDSVGSEFIFGQILSNGTGTFLEVGTGNGQLLKFLHNFWQIPKDRLKGMDVSEASVGLIRREGFSAALGSLPEVASGGDRNFLEDQNIQTIILSYFIDRDRDQKGTFDVAIKTLAEAPAPATLVLEGLFPVKAVDSQGRKYASHDSLITKGRAADDDIERVVHYVEESSERALRLHRIVVGERLVYSLDDFEILPSTTLIFATDY